jgi:hypothetical protein
MSQLARGLSGQVLPNHPKLLPGEMLTSWLVRTAHANSMKIQRLLDLAVGRDVPTLQRDYDRFAPTSHLQRFSEMTGETLDRLEASTLRVFEGTFVDAVRLNGSSRWVLAQGVYHRKRTKHGLQYCPLCIKLDPTPYFRTVWRCAFYIECSDHHVQMEDACPECDAPIIPFRVELGKRRSTLSTVAVCCHSCGFDLRQTLPKRIAFPTWQLAVDLRSLLIFHWYPDSVLQGASDLATRQVFRDWWTASALIRSSAFRITGIDLVMSDVVFAALETNTLWRRSELETRRILERVPLLLLGLWLLQNWPKHLELAMCRIDAHGRVIRRSSREWERTLDIGLRE